MPPKNRRSVPMLGEAIGEDTWRTMWVDPVVFVRSFDREPWPYQAATLRAITARSNGDSKPLTFDQRISVVSWPRQNGKSTLSAWAALWRLYCDPEPQEIVSVALDRDSARIILNDARRIIQESGVLFDLVDSGWGLTKSSIRLRDGRTWTVKSSDAIYSRGMRPTMVCYDEMGWTSDDGELFQVLSAGMAAAINPLMVITSTAGPVQSGPLWELFQRADDPGVLLLYGTENKSPRISQEFLDSQKEILPPSVYAREHENRWSEGSDVFCTGDDLARATSEYDPIRESARGPTYAFADLGWAHDETAIAISKPTDDGVDIVHLKGIRGTRQDPVSLPGVQAYLEELVSKYGLKRIEIESPQGVGMVQSLSLRGVSAKVVYPTSKSNSERWGALYSALKQGKIKLPRDKILRRQLLTLTIKESLTGWRVIDQPSIHQDRAVACAGAYFLAENYARSIPILVVS